MNIDRATLIDKSQPQNVAAPRTVFGRGFGTRLIEWPWPYFTQAEMSCRHCGEIYSWPEFMEKLVAARRLVGQPFHILSAHRCAWHNARIGGAAQSQHLQMAVDIALYNHDRTDLYLSLQQAGFTGFGFYNTFLHADLGRPRHWYGSERARAIWRV